MRLFCLMIFAAAASAPAQNKAPQAPAHFNEAVARQAFQIAENWLRQGAAPKQWNLPLVSGDLTAVRATIRRDGKTFATATARVAEPFTADAEKQAADVMKLVHQAMTEAISKDLSTLARQKRSAGKPTLDLQFALSLKPIRVERPGQLLSRYVINRHGLAMVHTATRRWTWSFPGNNIAANTSPRNQLFAMMVPLNIPLTDIGRVGAADNKEHRLFRFDVIHLVQLKPAGKALSLTRGNLLLPVHPFGKKEMTDLSERLVRHLSRRQLTEGPWAGFLKDSIQPGDATYKMTPRVALHNAMAALALSRISRFLKDDPKLKAQARRVARDIVAKLLETQIAREAGKDPAVATRLDRVGLTLLAMLDMPELSARKKDRGKLAALVNLMLRPTGRFAIRPGPDAKAAQAEAQSIGAATLVGLYDLNRSPQTLQKAHGALVQSWALIRDEDERAVTVLPWLPYGELALASMNKPSPGFKAMRSVSEKLWLKQMSEENINPQMRPGRDKLDTTGGLVLGVTAFNEPNALTAPALITQALALRHGLVDRKDTKQLTAWLVRCGWAVRFLDQLAMAPTSCYYLSNPADHVGGIRQSLWNNRQSLQDSALALLALAELQAALQQLDAGDLRAAGR